MVFNVTDSDDRKTITDFPRKVRKIEHIWIPMSDGAKLAATIWLPEDAEENPVPAILEYIPYRKDDFTAIRDSIRHPYFAGHGYASIRVDIRGSGNSDGILPDEYLKQEQDDALDVFEWIIQQTWSTGSIGMIGKSWGGFSGLQVAARQHPALKTIITLCSTDDRYGDDVHYRGGNILASDMLWWASTMFAYSARPQDPEVVGESWKENWLERLNTTPYVNEWMNHQRLDDYWKHGSVSDDYSDVQIPVLTVSGWEDGYTDAVFRLVENLPYAKGIIGPWSHDYPEVATPDPAIGFLQEALRWWDQWLKNIDTGVKEDPVLVSWIQDSELPQVNYEVRPGKWVADNAWPSENIKRETFYLQENSLVKEFNNKEEIIVPSVQEHGYYAGVYCPFGEPGDLPSDQRLENGKAVVFQTEPFEKDYEYLGNPIFNLTFTSDEEEALVAIRLNNVAPTGESTLISWGMLNLNHLTSHESPESLIPGKEYQAKIELDAIGQHVPVGNRLEIAISPTYWPQAWPSKKPVILKVIAGEQTNLSLPVRKASKQDEIADRFEGPEIAEIIERKISREENRTRQISHDTINDKWKLEDFSDEGERILLSNGIRHGSINKNTYTIKSGDPLSAKVECDWELTVGRGKDWNTKLVTNSVMTSDKDYFYLENTLLAYLNDEEFFERTWKEKIARDFQ